jgi:plastocyanin
MPNLTNNKLTSFVKRYFDKLRFYAREKPKVAVPLYAVSALTLILLVSFIIAAITIDKQTTLTPPVSAPTAQVQITKDGFLPATLVVQKGTKVIWTNTDDNMHQMQANPHPSGDSLPGLKSEILNHQQTYEYTADTAGTFGYHDHLNPTTNGTLEVQE